MPKLFGTDGIRGIAFDFLNYELAFGVGSALGCVLNKNGAANKKVLIGMDTRISGKMISDAISDGLNKKGFDTYIAGVVPTPAIAYLTAAGNFAAGVMVSASHNPYEYNGIKIFGPKGFKLTDAEEEQIEAIMASGDSLHDSDTKGRVYDAESLKENYVNYLLSCQAPKLSGLRMVIDCANGSAAATAKDIFSGLGADITFIACEPDGENINSACGSTHLSALKAFVTDGGYDLGIAFDGDADRCLFVDEGGREIDGDFVLAILSLMLKREGKLLSDTVVGTVMANCGLIKFCEEHGINFTATKVGDRYVLEEMEKSSYSLGGEQSGHIIIRHCATTGDGQLTALFLLAALMESGQTLSALASVMKKYPQHMINIHATPAGKDALFHDEEVKKITKAAEAELAGIGRLLIRPSGTEPLVRIMIECSDKEKTTTLCESVASGIEEALKKYN